MDRISRLALELGRDPNEPGTSRLAAAIENGELPAVSDPLDAIPADYRELADIIAEKAGNSQLVRKSLATLWRAAESHARLVDSTARLKALYQAPIGHTLSPITKGGPCE